MRRMRKIVAYMTNLTGHEHHDLEEEQDTVGRVSAWKRKRESKRKAYMEYAVPQRNQVQQDDEIAYVETYRLSEGASQAASGCQAAQNPCESRTS